VAEAKIPRPRKCDDHPVGRPRQTACAFGHPFTPANVRYNAAGSQECCACARRRSRQWQRQHRASQPIVDDKRPTFALVVYPSDGHGGIRARWTYHQTRAAAAELAPDDCPYTIVDISRKPWIDRPSIGKGVPMHPKQLARLKAAVAANTKPMQPHPGGLAGRVRDALDDAALLDADPNASPEAKETARRFAAAMVAALRAETSAH
jgi:hypothetical protein